jgi:hypothetical protein
MIAAEHKVQCRYLQSRTALDSRYGVMSHRQLSRQRRQSLLRHRTPRHATDCATFWLMKMILSNNGKRRGRSTPASGRRGRRPHFRTSEDAAAPPLAMRRVRAGLARCCIGVPHTHKAEKARSSQSYCCGQYGSGHDPTPILRLPELSCASIGWSRYFGYH